jgi:argininosuccinate synthase
LKPPEKETNMSDTRPIVLAYSGGLDTSFCVPWLKEKYGCEVITVTVDTGGLDDEKRGFLDKRARALGSKEHFTLDGRRAFFDETLRFLIMGNVLRGHVYPLCVGAERTMQARMVAEYAAKIGARGVAHGSTAAGNDQVRFEVAFRTLAGSLEIIAPVRDEGFAREYEVSWLRERGFEFPSEKAVYSINLGLWGCTIGGRETAGSTESIPEEAWLLTKGTYNSQLSPEKHTIGFNEGVPVSLDGKELDPVTLIEKLNVMAGRFGIGRGIHMGDTIFGLKGRVAFEAPAATVLITAHRELEKLVLTGRQQRLKDQMAAAYGEMVHEALSLDPACRDIEAMLLSSQKRVTGQANLLFRQGALFVEGVSSPFSLKAASTAEYGEAAGEWTAVDARGFSRMLALPSMLHARAGSKKTK